MESLEIINYTVTDNQLNEFEAEISFLYSGKQYHSKIRSPWKKESIQPHSISIVGSTPFNEEQKEYFKKSISIFLKKRLL